MSTNTKTSAKDKKGANNNNMTENDTHKKNNEIYDKTKTTYGDTKTQTNAGKHDDGRKEEDTWADWRNAQTSTSCSIRRANNETPLGQKSPGLQTVRLLTSTFST